MFCCFPLYSMSLITKDYEKESSWQNCQFSVPTRLNQIIAQVVAESFHPDISGSESDLGLTPGSRVKLIKSSSVILTSPLRWATVIIIINANLCTYRDTRLRTAVKSFELQLLPSNNSHFYVATDTVGSWIFKLINIHQLLMNIHSGMCDAWSAIRWKSAS